MGKDSDGGGVTIPRAELEKNKNKGSCHVSAYGVLRQLWVHLCEKKHREGSQRYMHSWGTRASSDGCTDDNTHE